ncbi:SIMPL domain-containing protein [Sporosarcina soli]|uniref:SIMPL domain-containing protein n=1 Tax=Sporosarcina soli TaxID=334736 RepID=A0ABW0TQ92_9BACL
MYYPYMQMPRHHRRIMTVTGIGNVSIAPDIVRIQMEVITENKQLQRAQQENASVMSGVIESLVALGIDRNNIQTVSYNITPQYDYLEGEQRFRGYQVTNAITVQTTNIQQIGPIIDTAVQNGVNRVSNIQFTVADEQKYYQQALSLALENAVAKAETIARTMQLQLEPQPIRIVEEISGQPVAYRALASEVSTPIEQGQVSIHAKVEVQFEY